MSLILIEPPQSDPATLDEVKQHIRVDHDDEDERIVDFIRTATQHLDGYDGILGRCLSIQTWRLTLDRLAGEIVLPLPPCQEVVSITYKDTAGAIQTMPPATYEVLGLGDSSGARIRPAPGQAWPSVQATPEVASITFIAGYPDDAGSPPSSTVPEPIRTAIKLHAAHLFANRESVLVGDSGARMLPHGYDGLIQNFRMWSF